MDRFHPSPSRRIRAWAAAALLGLAPGCAYLYPAPPPPQPEVAAIGEIDEYVIGVPDELDLAVWQHPDLSRPLLVRRDGMVSVPLLGDVEAEGLTPAQLADRIEKGLSAYVTRPHVDVSVTAMRSQVVSVIGAGVVRSGIVELQRNTRVVDALAAMGGLTPFAKKRRIRVLRDTPKGRVEIPFDYVAFVDGRAPESNIRLAPGDTIIVPE